MNDFAKLQSSHRRICILRSLSSAPSCRMNDSLLQAVLEDFGLSCSRDVIRTELNWLAEQGLVTCQDLAGVTVAELTGRGDDVAAGRTTVPGVKRPSPR